jgi:cystathionine beta-lyase/cystathionine gamma-synthase
MKLTDLKAYAKLAKARGILFAVDNTFSSSILQNPLLLGADIIIYSLTKFINGHSDVGGGMIVAKDEVPLNRLQKFRCFWAAQWTLTKLGLSFAE